MHYVYVLRSVRDDGFYIGYTSNLRLRLRQRLEGDCDLIPRSLEADLL
jgi:predicted GIY-YIG superfamily endonuclease